MASPPSALGVAPMAIELEPSTWVVSVGASGTVAATNELEATESALSPKPLVATAVQVYVFVLESEETVTGEVAEVFDWLVPPSLESHVTE